MIAQSSVFLAVVESDRDLQAGRNPRRPSAARLQLLKPTKDANQTARQPIVA
jgi:hypothetical protein